MKVQSYLTSQFIMQVLSIMPCFVLAIPYPPDTPCPHIFTYERILQSTGEIIFPGKDNNYWRGVIHVPGHILKPGEAVHLKVLLAVPIALPNKYVGRVEFRGNKDKLLEGILDPVEYYDVFFPSNAPIPSLLQVRVNDQALCNGRSPRAPVVTRMILEHSLFPLRINISRRGSFGDIGKPGPSDKGFNTTLSCGIPTTVNPLIVGGSTSVAGQWPWLVPIFMAMNNGRSVQFQCGGTLVSEKFVMSAAHCFRDVSGPKDLVVYAGRRNIRNWADTESQPRAVKSIIVHPDFEPGTLYSDLALLELSSPVSWSKTVYPVCLWNGPKDLDHIVGRKATVVGWGTDDAEKTQVTSEPRSAELPVVSQETCLRSSREFYFLSSNRSLCAGAREGSGPCNGDSGGGLYIPVKDPGGSTRWYLRGIVSLSLVQRETLRCDLQHYTVFTDVAQFRPWIKSILAPVL